MSKIELPTKPVKAEVINAKSMVIYSKPKAGKTTALSLLEDNLIIDIDNHGTKFLDALKVKIDTFNELKQVALELKTKKEKEGFQYKYITIDTLTVLEDIANDFAIDLYKQTPMGSKFGGKPGEDSIKKLPNGAGYFWIREAVEKIINLFTDLPSECLILSGHTADKQINRDGEEISEMQLALSGKLASIICAKVDAVGYLYRQGDKVFLNFKGGQDAIVEARPVHLRNKKFVLTEKVDEKLVNNWNQIFI